MQLRRAGGYTAPRADSGSFFLTAGDRQSLSLSDEPRGHRAGKRRRQHQPALRACRARGQAVNWVQTVPGKSWFAMLRLYGPLAPWFDKTWRPSEIEPLSGAIMGA